MIRIVALAVAIGFGFSLAVGCTRQGGRSGRPLAWSELSRFADVTFGDAVWDGQKIRIPVETEWNSGNSLHVLRFTGNVSGDAILVSATLDVPDGSPNEGDIAVSLPDPVLTRYSLLYSDVNGTVTPIKTIRMPQD